MIKPEELRIGNWVNRLGNPTVINSIQKGVEIGYVSTPISGSITTNQIEPIPLTEEILIKAGFEKQQPSFDARINIFYQNIEIYTYESTLMEGSFYIGQDEDSVLIYSEKMYVHQLQNLFYSLTGTELKIQL